MNIRLRTRIKPTTISAAFAAAGLAACSASGPAETKSRSRSAASSDNVGCYADSDNRDLPYFAYDSASNTTETCISTCAAAGYAYAGTQYSSQCFCGNAYGGQGTSSNCDMACSGDGSETCGGSWANSVYATATASCPGGVDCNGNPVTSGTRVCGTDLQLWDCTSSGWQPTGSACTCGGPTCIPSCSDKQCGGDGCGGSCGSCSSGQTCNSSGQCVTASCSGGGGTGVSVTVAQAGNAGWVPPRFAGLSFEKSHLTNHTLRSGNSAMVALFNLLGPSNLRIGADDVDVTTWDPSAQAVSGPDLTTVGTVEVDDLAGLLSATGWNVIYGLNLKTGTPQNSAAEAAYASGALGGSLYGFEIGNEIDAEGDYSSVVSRWQSFASAVLAAAPGARFVGPGGDPGAEATFTAPFAHDEASKLVLLTQHYYRDCGCNFPSVNELLYPDPELTNMLQIVGNAAAQNGIADGFRLGEANSFYDHGEAGVSDALASALWSIDFMFTSAMYGAKGVRLPPGRVGYGWKYTVHIFAHSGD